MTKTTHHPTNSHKEGSPKNTKNKQRKEAERLVIRKKRSRNDSKSAKGPKNRKETAWNKEENPSMAAA